MKNYIEYKRFTLEKTINNIRTILTDLNILVVVRISFNYLLAVVCFLVVMGE